MLHHNHNSDYKKYHKQSVRRSRKPLKSRSRKRRRSKKPLKKVGAKFNF